MPLSVQVPVDFEAVVITLPADMGTVGTTRLLELVHNAGLEKQRGHRVIHLHQVERLDSSAVAALIALVNRVRRMGYEVALCEPPPVVRSYLEIYGTTGLLEGALLGSDGEGMYRSDLVPFVPPFVPEPRGRIDIYAPGRVRSMVIGSSGLEDAPPPNLSKHPPKAAARAQVMAVHESEKKLQELRAASFVWMRRHMCGCSNEHTTFENIHRLHQWYRGKAFDFLSLELWASDQPAGIVTEKLAFRDRGHHMQFETLLKIDESWQPLATMQHPHEDEYYYIFG